MSKSLDFILELPDYAHKYMDYCMSHKKEVATGSGKIVSIEDRHIHTIAYFLNIWMPRNCGETMTRDNYYKWLNGDDKLKKETIKHIDELFKALAGDIVANEGKGIFYAKNKLGWTDRLQTENTNTNINANFGNIIQPPSEPTDNP